VSAIILENDFFCKTYFEIFLVAKFGNKSFLKMVFEFPFVQLSYSELNK